MNINLTELNFSVCYESKSLPPLDSDRGVYCTLQALLVASLLRREETNVNHTVPARAVIYSKRDILIR